MIEISPVLSEKFSQPTYVPASVNFTTGGGLRRSADAKTEAATETDARRYTKFDRAASDAGVATDFTFDDFLDLVNPLEHIPGVSSIFRALHGDTIHPVSRVAGDILYGGVFGLGSAVFGAAGAVADCVSEASNGQDATGMVIASLLGEQVDAPQKQGTMQVASSLNQEAIVSQSSSASSLALAAMMQHSSTAQATAAEASQNSAISPSALSSSSINSASDVRPTEFTYHGQGKAYSLDRSKLPYGGVLAPVNGTSQTQALALSSVTRSQRIGSTIYTSKSSPQAPLPVSEQVSSTSPDGTSSVSSHNPLPQALVDDLLAMRAIKQYESVASGRMTGSAN